MKDRDFSFYRSIPQLMNPGRYHVDSEWEYFVDHYVKNVDGRGFAMNLDPEYQRGHVWTREQEIAFVEFSLRGGMSARTIYLNCPRWTSGHGTDLEVVDGKQRITAVVRYLDDVFPAFGKLRSESGDLPRSANLSFSVNVAELDERRLVYEWYYQLNSGGTAHTKEELEKVLRLMEAAEEGMR